LAGGRRSLPLRPGQRHDLADAESLLTQNAPAELRGGIVSVDRLIQQVSKTVSTTVVGLLLVATELSTIFWFLGLLSFISVALMAALLPTTRSR
jgi:hypothetical protein